MDVLKSVGKKFRGRAGWGGQDLHSLKVISSKINKNFTMENCHRHQPNQEVKVGIISNGPLRQDTEKGTAPVLLCSCHKCITSHRSQESAGQTQTEGHSTKQGSGPLLKHQGYERRIVSDWRRIRTPDKSRHCGILGESLE